MTYLDNKHKVPKKVWKRWCDAAKFNFNSYYDAFNKELAKELPALAIEKRKRIAWNHAFYIALEINTMHRTAISYVKAAGA